MVTTDARRGDCTNADGLLAGLSMAPEEYAKIARITRDIVANSDPHDAIYVFPHEPIFYLLSGRALFAEAVVSWFDFMSDAEVLALNRRLAAGPPKVLVLTRLPDIVLTSHERLFRGGRPLAQRRIIATVEKLAKTGVIGLVDTVHDLDGLTIEVYVRRQPTR